MRLAIAITNKGHTKFSIIFMYRAQFIIIEMAGSSMSANTPSHYESIRLKNLEDNKRILASFGLLDPVSKF